MTDLPRPDASTLIAPLNPHALRTRLTLALDARLPLLDPPHRAALEPVLQGCALRVLRRDQPPAAGRHVVDAALKVGAEPGVDGGARDERREPLQSEPDTRLAVERGNRSVDMFVVHLTSSLSASRPDGLPT